MFFFLFYWTSLYKVNKEQDIFRKPLAAHLQILTVNLIQGHDDTFPGKVFVFYICQGHNNLSVLFSVLLSSFICK